jgi:hypothetical protein
MWLRRMSFDMKNHYQRSPRRVLTCRGTVRYRIQPQAIRLIFGVAAEFRKPADTGS